MGGLVLIVYFISRYTYLTKKMLAEEGMLGKKTGLQITKLDIAYVSIGLGVGLLLSAGLSRINLDEQTFDLIAWGIVLISGAVGLLLAIQKKQ